MIDELVSVIIPTYKGSDVIKRAIESVLNQSYPLLEIIVVDDNNPDSEDRKETERIMLHYAENPRVKYLKHEKNKNGAAARNTGIVSSHGEYIAFLDADDWFLPLKIERQLVFLYNHQEYDACYCLARKKGTPIQTIPYEGSLKKELLMMQTNMFTPSLLFRSNVLKKFNGFDESFRRHQDYERLLRFFSEGFRIGCLREVLLELGTSENWNSLAADRLLSLKDQFLNAFNSDLDELETQEPGINKKIIALHYGIVFLSYVLEKKFVNAARLSIKYFWYSPYYYTKSLRERCTSYIKRKMHISNIKR